MGSDYESMQPPKGECCACDEPMWDGYHVCADCGAMVCDGCALPAGGSTLCPTCAKMNAAVPSAPLERDAWWQD